MRDGKTLSMQRERFLRCGEDFAGWRGGALIAGEETMSREARQDTKVPTRHLMPFGAAQ
jgi:hypothetical protein